MYGNTPKTKRKSSYNYQGAIKGTAAGLADIGGQRLASSVVRGKKAFVQYGSGLGQYAKKLGKGGKAASKTLGLAGSIASTGYDMSKSIRQRQYAGAIVDAGAGIAGGVAGYGIGLSAGMVITTCGAPALFVGAVGFGIAVGAGVEIDKQATRIKQKYYSR